MISVWVCHVIPGKELNLLKLGIACNEPATGTSPKHCSIKTGLASKKNFNLVKHGQNFFISLKRVDIEPGLKTEKINRRLNTLTGKNTSLLKNYPDELHNQHGLVKAWN